MKRFTLIHLLPLLALLLAGAAAPAGAAVQIRLSGDGTGGPLAPDENGRFAFNNVPLRRNSVNRFTVTATGDDGQTVSRDIQITQISLQNVVVAKVTTRPLDPVEIEQLVADGVIDLDDPENFNVSVFQIVLTIGGQPVPIDIPIPQPKVEPEIVGETYSISDPGSGRSTGRPVDMIIFEAPIEPSPYVPQPPRLPGVILIEGRIKSLKEFFSVRLLLMNTSGIFTLGDVKAQLSFPAGGLTSILPESGLGLFGDILPGDPESPGQGEREFIVRGDQIGVRPVRLEFGGVLKGPGIPEDEPVPFGGAAEATVEVKGPPSFKVLVDHPDAVEANVPYELTIDIQNTGETPALYASLQLDIGADAVLLEEGVDENGNPVMIEQPEGITRNFGHLYPGDTTRQVYLVKPFNTGPITSCMGVSDQNIALQVRVGAIGCITGHRPPERADFDGPAVNVLPAPNMFGIGTDSPVVAFFSRLMNEASITYGGSFKLLDNAGNLVPCLLRFENLNGNSVAFVQVQDGITNRLAGNTRYTVVLEDTIRDTQGNTLAERWVSEFTTTSATDDFTPPQVTLGYRFGFTPEAVAPGEIVELEVYAADQGSGLDRIEVRLLDADTPDAQEQLIDQKIVQEGSYPPVLFGIDTNGLVPGHAHQIHVMVHDKAGNIGEGTLAFVLETGVPLPSIALPADPSDPYPQGPSFIVTPLTVGASVRSIAWYLDGGTTPIRTTSIAPWQLVLGTLNLAAGDHTLRAIASDGLGRTAEDLYNFTIEQDTTPPVVEFLGATPGAVYLEGSSFPVSGRATHSSGIDSIEFRLDTPGGTLLSEGAEPFLLDTSGLATGPHTIILLARNRLGVSNDPADPSARLAFFVASPASGGTPPPPPAVDPLTAPRMDGTVMTGGATAAGARVDVTNVPLGLTSSVFAGADGRFALAIAAGSGDLLRFVAYDFNASASPSAPVELVVPAPPALTAITVDPPSILFTAAGQFRDLAVTAHYSDGSTTIVTANATFSSAAPAIASVGANGRVVAQAPGTTSIGVQFGGLNVAVPVDAQIVILTALSARPSPILMSGIGQTVALTVIGHYNNGTTTTLPSGNSFSTADATIATVSAAGIVTARAVGATTIRVSRGGLTPADVPVTVNLADAQPPAVEILSPANGADVERGDTVSVNVRGTDAAGILSALELDITGAATFSDSRDIQPVSGAATRTFAFTVPANAPVGGAIQLSALARNSAGKVSAEFTITLDVVDATAPVVTIEGPPAGTPYNFGDTIPVAVHATDAVGVTRLRLVVSDSFDLEREFVVTPSSLDARTTFSIEVPFGLTRPDVVLNAFAHDAAGNVGASAPAQVVVTGADIDPPATHVTAVGAPAGPQVLVSYQVDEGLSDLGHVELYFRRNGIGTFNRYTDAAHPDGLFTPQSGASGSILFDATRMGGNGSYEFHTIGVDDAGNREPAPVDAGGDPVADPSALAAISGVGAVTTINTDADIVNSSFDDRNLRIDGARVTLVGFHVFRNIELINGAVLTHRETDTASTASLAFDAWTLSIDATSAIDLTGRGYIGGREYRESGRTVGNLPGSHNGAGGSHGGLGGSYSGAIPAPVYDNFLDPLLPGGGGGAWEHFDGGDGGGMLTLTAINLAIDGAIRADGSLSGGSAAGNGAGGSVNIRTRTLSGRGAISANGAGNGLGVGGGGGRVAIRHLDLTIDPANITARGEQGQYGNAAANGTVFLKTEGEDVGGLVVEGRAPTDPFTELPIPDGVIFDSITLRNFARVIVDKPLRVRGRLLLEGESILTHADVLEAGLLIEADDVIVEAGSAIDVTGRGYNGGRDYREPGRTLRNSLGAPRGVAGSHGGHGGVYENALHHVYGNPLLPLDLGAGGGAWEHFDGGDGGGRIVIRAARQVVVDGAIRANGAISEGSAAGNGAGGSILIETSRLAGAGLISANGGGAGTGVGGGGGRIAVIYDYVDALHDFNGLRDLTAYPGSGLYDNRRAAAGSVYLRRNAQNVGILVVDGGLAPGQTSPAESTLVPIGPGVAVSTTADSLELDGKVPVIAGGLAGLRLNPDLLQAHSFLILDNTTTSVTVQTPNEQGVHFSAVAAPGRRYGASWTFADLLVRGGAYLELADPLVATDSIRLTGNSVLAHEDAAIGYAPSLDLETDLLQIEPGSRIDVTGRGYPGGREYREPGRTTGDIYGSQRGTGGSHGGLGGIHENIPGAAFGDIYDPDDFGAGGGAWEHDDGGDGGGRVRIVVGTLLLGGNIIADGARSAGSAAGNGAGGSVGIIADSLEGAGLITVLGGQPANGVGGGGGRVALRVASTLAIDDDQVRIYGIQGAYGTRGGAGTLFIQRPGQPIGDLVIDAFGNASPHDTTSLPVDHDFDNIYLRRSARLTADFAIRLAHDLSITSGSVLTHSREWTPGLAIEVDRLIIDATSSIDLTGRGWRGGIGYREPGTTHGNLPGALRGAGGSHGGWGGSYEGHYEGQVYGNPFLPITLGAGGGAWEYEDGGYGGGRLDILARLDLLNDGVIRADGALSAGSAAGNGAGGSILIQTPLLHGLGLVSAQGGGAGSGVGGGGGRIAIIANLLDDGFDAPGRISAAAGRRGFDNRTASAGTLLIRRPGQAAGELIIDDALAGTTAPRSTPLNPFGPATVLEITGNAVRVETSEPIVPGGLVGLRLRPSVLSTASFEIISNTTDMLVVQVPGDGAANPAAVSGPGASAILDWNFDNVTLRRGGSMILGDPLRVGGFLNLVDASLITAFPNAGLRIFPLDLSAGAIAVGPMARIDVTGRGWRGGLGYREAGRTLLGADGSTNGAGGSHAGLGGAYLSAMPNPVYGNPDNPVDPGSGGAAYDHTDGGSGGGLLFLEATSLLVDGVIAADGAGSAGSAAGSGSGGTINISVGTLAGAGSIHADGALVGSAGGGGRVRIRYSGSNTLPPANVQARGGQGHYGTPAAAGSVILGVSTQGDAQTSIRRARATLSPPASTFLRSAADDWTLYR